MPMKKVIIRYSVVSFVLVLFLVLSLGCNLLTDTGTQSPTATNGDIPISPGWTLPDPTGPYSPLPDFADVVEKVKPSVVAIDVEMAFDDIHQGFIQSAGSGWIIDGDGIIVTNSHVVNGADRVIITLDDGRTLEAQAVRTDPITDLAIVKIDAQNLPVADIGNSSRLRVGEPVAAIGNALGLGISMKGGWVSRLDASLFFEDGQALYGLIETDAAINRGNSGGPLVNMAGEVIGITSAKLFDIDAEGIGYAISINSAIPIIEALITNGYVIRPFLGVGDLLTMDQAAASFYGLSVNNGVLIGYIVPDGPAAKAGLQAEDIIIRLDDEVITTVEGLLKAIHSKEIDQTVKITYWRGGVQSIAWATLTESPPP